MKRVSLSFFLTAIISCSIHAGVTEQYMEWEPSCNGSNITITKDGNNIVSIEAYAEHFDSSRQWTCHFINGKIISAHYKLYQCTRHATNDPEKEGEFTITLTLLKTQTFHLPDHDTTKLPEDLRKDLTKLLEKTQKK